ncbi:MAG TPA: AzlD domain-containing protein [Burkholderiales bacterium]|nr:AzlD domain-containing protein [Burkholderiales bacterium]
MHSTELGLVVVGAIAGTYVWRGLGVVLSGRLSVESELFNWVACVAYAMIAGLIARVILMPTGLLGETLLAERLIACALALVAFYATRRNLFVGVISGMIVIIALGQVRGYLM